MFIAISDDKLFAFKELRKGNATLVLFKKILMVENVFEFTISNSATQSNPHSNDLNEENLMSHTGYL